MFVAPRSLYLILLTFNPSNVLWSQQPLTITSQQRNVFAESANEINIRLKFCATLTLKIRTEIRDESAKMAWILLQMYRRF